MATLYLTEQQTLVKKDGDTLLVSIPADQAAGRPKRDVRVPLMKIDRVVVQGNATLTSPAIAALMERRADVTFLDAYGRFQGQLTPPFSKNGRLRLAQTAAHVEGARRVALARSFVGGKLHNMRTMLQRANRKRESDDIGAAVEMLRRLAAEAAVLPLPDGPLDPAQPQRDSPYGRLQGIEGAGTAAYFGCFRHVINEPGLFNGRTRRPPRDPANALLSYGYTILMHQVASAVSAVGLDPYVGYLHGSQYGKPALALDLMEEFRPLVVDSVVWSVFNTGMLGAGDFVVEMGAYRLTDKGRRTFLTRLEERLEETITHPIFNYKASYRRCLELQARLLAKTLTGEIPAYPPFVTR